MAGLSVKCARRVRSMRFAPGAGNAAYFEALEKRILFAAGLVGAWSFDEGAGTAVADVSGSGNNGVISGATWSASGKYGKALSFNGTSNLVTITDSASLHLTNGMTLEAWVNPKSLTGFETAVMKERTGGLSYALYTSNNTSKPPAAYINTGGNDISQPAASNLVLNTWTFLTATYDGAKLNIYVNGTLSKSKNVTGNMVASTGALRIGGNSVWGEYFNGLIDNVRVYNRALTATEIQTDMTSPVISSTDTTPPTVTGMSPANGVTNVSPGTTITATFSESIQNGTAVFSVKDAANNAVAGTVSYPDATHATFTPGAALAATTQFTVSVSGAKDLAGNTMSAPATWSFTTATPDTTPPTVTSLTPAVGATNVLTTATVTAVFSEPIQPATLSMVLRDSKSTLVPSTVSYNAATMTATLTPTSALTAGTTYTLVISGAADLSGNVMDHVDSQFSSVPAGTGPFSIWQPTDAPVVVADSETSASEVGVKFRTDVDGYITGIRFYKASINSGVHVGDVWTSTGSLLGSATFTGETASGWQQMNFASPVFVQANTTYVASYHTNVGHYSEDDNYFAAAGRDSGPLHALKAGVDGFNGVYAFGPAGTFPTQNYLSANYWVDVVFTSAGVVGPQVISKSPAQGATNVSVSTTLSATFNESVVAGSISFTLRDSANNPVAGTSNYVDATRTVTFTPTASLTPGISYTATVSGATDAGNNVMANPVSWTFNTATAAADPSVVGQWSGVTSWPLIAINQVLLKDGRILMWDGGPTCIGSSSATVYNPANGTFTPVPVPNPQNDNDIFCSGQVVLADGRVVVVGGHDCTGRVLGSVAINIFNPTTMTWTRGPNMAFARWYPTATLLSDGRVLITAGSDTSNTTYDPIPEVYDPVTNTVTKLTTASKVIANYPFVYQLPNGNVLVAGSDENPMGTFMLNVATQTWTTIDATVLDAGTSVMYRPGQIMKMGSSYHSDSLTFDYNPSSAATYVLNMNQPSPTWQQTSSAAYGRAHHTMTMLPDGNVLLTGGSNVLGGWDPTTAVYAAEIWSPTTQAWSTMASDAVPRMYHSTALLLPDGRILSAGGGRNYVNNADYPNMEIYSPPYLFKGARPTITSSPSLVNYNASFFVGTPDGASIASVALIKNTAVTHEINMDQRYIPLTFTQTAGGLNVQAPVDANLATPGYYMLFIVNSNGVPSIAPFVRLPAGYEDATPPSTPLNLQAAGGIGTVGLTWNASTDNVGVAGYNVYRSTTSGFTPSAANQIAQTTTTSYTDTVPAGTYYYVVKARDIVGNLSAPSAQATGIAAIDSVSPTVSMTAPASNATVSGTITVSATANDNVAVAGVQFLLDGNALGAEDTSSPYTISWTTSSTTNGLHTLTARARDAQGNQTVSSAVTVNINNTVPSNLVASYNFNQGAGSTLTDSSGHGLNGTTSNTTWVSGHSGGALSFNGTSSWVTIADNNLLDLTTGMTLEAWVDPAAMTGWNAIILKERPSGLAYALYAEDNTGQPPAGYIDIAGSDKSAVGTTAIPLNAWTHLATTYDGANLRMYVNGVLVKTTAVTGSIISSTGVLRIGGDSIWGEYFNGLIDDVRIYNAALTASQIVTDMNTPVN